MSGSPANGERGPLTLDRLDLHRAALVSRVDPGAAAQPAERARQLADIGFVPGESVTVVARAFPGGDPLVVRVGHSRFALRRAEAACVQVQELA
jgi:ferrous iron transport protein A